MKFILCEWGTFPSVFPFGGIERVKVHGLATGPVGGGKSITKVMQWNATGRGLKGNG